METEYLDQEEFGLYELFFTCPKCHFDFLVEGYNFCPNCGERLVWSEVDEYFTIH